jgi:hypothetical protein
MFNNSKINCELLYAMPLEDIISDEVYDRLGEHIAELLDLDVESVFNLQISAELMKSSVIDLRYITAVTSIGESKYTLYYSTPQGVGTLIVRYTEGDLLAVYKEVTNIIGNIN